MEAFTGIGLAVGPIFGSTLFSFFGFGGAFLIYGAFQVSLSLVIKCFFPRKANVDIEPVKNSDLEEALVDAD